MKPTLPESASRGQRNSSVLLGLADEAIASYEEMPVTWIRISDRPAARYKTVVRLNYVGEVPRGLESTVLLYLGERMT